jgi:1,4-alpha-glucan branching enzyme
MLYKMPGDAWQKFANLRLLYSYMFLHPGAKLMFMGNEFAATKEWDFQSELQWDLLQYPNHGGMKYCVQELNALYKAHLALYELQYEEGGFEWVELNQRQEGIIAFKRKAKDPDQAILVVFNMTPVPRHQFPIRVKGKTIWKEIFNSDDQAFWGSGNVKNQNIQCISVDGTNQLQEILLELPPLAAVVFK